MSIFLIGLKGQSFPEDLTGFKLVPRGPGATEEIEALGAVSALIVFSEIFIALQSGVVDGVLATTAAERDAILTALAGDGFYITLEGSDPPAEVPTAGPDDLSGTNAADVVKLLAGDDIFRAGGGADKVWGQAGADTIFGGNGNDRLFGGGGRDALSGNKGADRLAGGAASDKLWGQGGADKLFGDAGNDRLWGQGGKDVLNGGKGGDVLRGGGGNDTLNGDAGSDTLFGDAGKDKLNGGAGNDMMTGGGGADIFIFESTTAKNHDTITDFQKGVDTIRVSDGDYRLVKTGGDVVVKFGGGNSLTLDGVSGKKAVAAAIEVIGGTTPTPTPIDSDPALIFDLGGKLDKSLNESAYHGAERWAAATGQTYSSFEITSEAQRDLILRRFIGGDVEPIVVIGQAYADSLNRVAPTAPDTSFAIIDAVVDQPNVSSYSFAIGEVAYVMGVIAALASESGKVGFVGGMSSTLMQRYVMAFEQGVMATDPQAEVIAHMTGSTPAAWNDPVKGVELANLQMSQGVDVIFTAAGGTSIGVFQAVADADKLFISADADFSYLHPDNALTAAVKEVGAVVEMIFEQGTGIAPGEHELGFAENAVAYAESDLMNRAMTRAADAAIADILSGKIVIDDPFDLA